ncbi:MAG: thymidine phosphorylase [Pseudomonadota bacterium]
MLFVDIIRRKRDGERLSEADIEALVAGLADESLPAEQVSALAMAVFFQGMSAAETGELTRAMAASGSIVDWSGAGLDGPVVDKHSTGGVGDKTSFVLAPVLAACGGYVPMISGRGLGHSGGTLDKLSAIPGYETQPPIERLRAVVADVGCAIIGQTADLAPADRRFYAIRDTTATVESVPLITASILSKKLAAGLEGLVMDVKWGSGAFMQRKDDARTLAKSLIDTAAHAGLATHALLTDMDQPLGLAAGNALEIAEIVDYFGHGPREPRLHAVIVALAAEMLRVTGLAGDDDEARARVLDALDDGRAAETFARMIAALGGPADFLERHRDYLPAAPVTLGVEAGQSGTLTHIDARAVGLSIVAMGGGRRRIADTLDLAVGYSGLVPVGTVLGPSDTLAVVHAPDRATAEAAAGRYRAACRFGDEAVVEQPVVLERLTPDTRQG